MNKKELRKQYLDTRNQMPEQEVVTKSNFIIKTLIHSAMYRQSDMVFTYVNMGTEVMTIPFIQKAWEDNKKVAVPVAVPKTAIMHFVEIHSLQELVPSHYGILEPKLSEENIRHATENTIVITPGAVFSKNGYRIGYGGGYYDRFFSTYPNVCKIGVCYQFQVVDTLQTDNHDEPVAYIITEKGIIKEAGQ